MWVVLALSRKMQNFRFPTGLQSSEIKKQKYKLLNFDLCVVIKDSESLVACLSVYKQKAFPYSHSASFLFQQTPFVSQALHHTAPTGAWLCHCNTLLLDTGAALRCPKAVSSPGWSSPAHPAPSHRAPVTDLMTLQWTCPSLLKSFLYGAGGKTWHSNCTQILKLCLVIQTKSSGCKVDVSLFGSIFFVQKKIYRLSSHSSILKYG